ncbi:unnamed protein product [Calypogeia fissa]
MLASSSIETTLGSRTAAATEMEVGETGETSQILPEDLVERIVAMIPFPSIFKARGLSKSWLARFSSLSSQQDEAQKCLVATFQRQVGKWSTNWETFSPVFFCKEDFIAYNRASQTWGKLHPLSFLPENMFTLNRFLTRSNLQMEGPLLYGFGRSESGDRMYELYVGNILTRSWKQLPPRPVRSSYVICSNLMIDPSVEAYKLILLCGSSDKIESGYFAQIYDSKSETWSSKPFAVSGDFAVGPSTAANLNEVLYIVAINNPQNVLAINVEEGTSQELSLSCDEVVENISVNVVVCKKDWLLMVTKGLYPETLQVLRIDLTSLRLVELARGPPAHLNVGNIMGQPVGDGDCIFFRVEDSSHRVLAYNVDEDSWSCFPLPAASNGQMAYKWMGSSFHPGLCPFVAV